MTIQPVEGTVPKSDIVRAVKKFVKRSPRCREPLGLAARYASIKRVQVSVIDVMGEVKFAGQGYVWAKFAFPGAESELDFVFYHKFPFEFSAYREGTEIVVYNAALRDEEYYENSAPPAELTEPESEPALRIPKYEYPSSKLEVSEA